MTPTVKHNESPNPVDIGVLGPAAVVPHPNGLAHAIEQLRWLRLHEDDDAIVTVEPTSGLNVRSSRQFAVQEKGGSAVANPPVRNVVGRRV
jgi:hypothetical protein